MSKLDGILACVHGICNTNIEHDCLYTPDAYKTEHTTKAKQAIEQWALDIVGEDEKYCEVEDLGRAVSYNETQAYSAGKANGRKELRAKLRERIGGSDGTN